MTIGRRKARLSNCRRRDIEPGEMLGFLTNVVLVDTAPRLEDFRFRL